MALGVTVVVPVRERVDELQGLLDALAAQTLGPDTQFTTSGARGAFAGGPGMVGASF